MINILLQTALFLSVLQVRVGYEENYPLSFTDESGNPSGLYIELFEEIARAENWQPIYVPEVWPNLTQMLLCGKIDLIACMTKSPEREEEFLFPDQSVEAGWSILLVHKDFPVVDLYSLNNQTIALIQDDFHSETLQELIENLDLTVNPLWCESYRQGVEAVLARQAVAVPVPKIIMLSPDFPEELAPQGIVWSPTAASFAGNHQHSHGIIEAINSNLIALKSDSSSVYHGLIEKWLSQESNKPVSSSFYILSAVVLAVFALIILLANRKLAREINRNRRTMANNRTLANIALAASEAENLDDLCKKVAEILKKSLNTENFYIAIHNPEADRFDLPVFSDERESVSQIDNSASFTSYVFRTGKHLVLDQNESRRMIQDPDIPIWCPDENIAMQFIAVPMKAGEKPIGVIGFQSYDDASKFNENDLHFVTSISGYIGDAVLRMSAWDEVERSRKRQKMLLDFDPAAIFLLDRYGNIVDCNRKALELAEIMEIELVGKPLSSFLIDSELREIDPIRTHNPEASSNFSCRFRGGDSVLYEVEGIVNSFVDDDSLFHFVTIIDVTEKNILEQEAMRNERLESIGLLAGGIAHDFNNILTGIMGSLSLLRSSSDTQNQRDKLLDSAEKAAQRARNLTGQLLTFAKGGSPIRKSVDTETMLKDVTEFVLRGSSVLLELDIEPGTWNLNVDSQQFSQVLQNIATNARQAMNNRGKLRVSAKNYETERGRLVLVEYEDTGPGIPEEIVGSIFDPYFTTKEEGHGLGLATCFSIIQRHGGTIMAGNGIHGGALFTLLVPASLDMHDGREGELVSSHPQHSGRILILDDDAGVLETAVKMLEALGYSSECARDGATAVAKYRKAFSQGMPYTIVVMDLTIPGGFGGDEAVKQVLDIDPSAIVVVSSGYARNDIMANYADYGFKGVLTKPYTITELSVALQKALAGKESDGTE